MKISAITSISLVSCFLETDLEETHSSFVATRLPEFGAKHDHSVFCLICGLIHISRFCHVTVIRYAKNHRGPRTVEPTKREDTFLISQLRNRTHSIFRYPPRDQPPFNDANMYGTHPTYTVLEEDGNAHSVLFLNSNAQEWALTPRPALTYRTIGGILDIYFFLGPSPAETNQQYTAAIGRFVYFYF